MQAAKTEAPLAAEAPTADDTGAGLVAVPLAPQPHVRYDLSKRVIDLLVAIPALVLALPPLAIAAAAMALSTHANPLYRQQRVGLGGRPFTVLKLRTMYLHSDRRVPSQLNETVVATFKVRRDPRVARGGALLRKFSVDELPQLWNVLRGEMSLVGPRPAIPEEVATYSAEMRRRLGVKPGLTAIWQVSGRSNIPFERWMAMDLAYLQRRSLAFDLWLLLRTPWAVISGRGAW